MDRTKRSQLIRRPHACYSSDMGSMRGWQDSTFSQPCQLKTKKDDVLSPLTSGKNSNDDLLTEERGAQLKHDPLSFRGDLSPRVSLRNRNKKITAVACSKSMRAVVDLTNLVPLQNGIKRKALQEIQRNEVARDTTKISKCSSMGILASESTVPVRNFPKLVSISKPRELTPSEAEAKVADIDLKIKDATTNMKRKQEIVRSLKKQLKEAEDDIGNLKLEQKRLAACKDRATVDVASDETKLLEEINKHSPNFPSEVAKNLVQDMCNLFRASQTKESAADLNECLDKLIHHLATAKRTEGLKAAIEYLLHSIRFQSSTGIEEKAIKTLYGTVLSDPKKVNPNAPYTLIAEAIVVVGTSADITTLIQCVISAAKGRNKPPRSNSNNSISSGHSSLEESENTSCPILDVMLPTFQVLKGSPKVADIEIAPLRSALKTALARSLFEKKENNQVPNYSMPKEADLAAKAGSNLLAEFLRSPKLQYQKFDLGKHGRMMIHQIIDNYIPGANKKIRHESEGVGRRRVLKVTKLEFSDTRMKAIRLEHQNLFRELKADEE